MPHRSPSLRFVGSLFFWIAILLGILLTLASAWPDMEATVYGFVKYTNVPLPSFSCPVLMTSLDRAPVSIRLHNPTDKPLTQPVRAQFSSMISVVTVDEKVKLQPGETRKLSWEVGEENVDLNNFIFARVLTFPSSSVKMSESTCGTLVLNLPFKGGPVIYYASLFLTVAGAGFGLLLFKRHSDFSEPSDVSAWSRMRFIAIFVAVGLLVSFLGWWPLAILVLAVSVVALTVFLMARKD